MRLSDWDLWAAAQHVVTGFGDGALNHVEDRSHDAVVDGNEEAVGTWLMVADRIKQLQALPGTGDVRH